MEMMYSDVVLKYMEAKMRSERQVIEELLEDLAKRLRDAWVNGDVIEINAVEDRYIRWCKIAETANRHLESYNQISPADLVTLYRRWQNRDETSSGWGLD